MQRCPDRRYMELKVKKVRYAIVYLTNKGIYATGEMTLFSEAL
jgi:hypothetical protein